MYFQEDLFYKTKEEQSSLLQQIIAANDNEGEEEKLPGEAGRSGATSAFGRKNASLASISGADDEIGRAHV